MDISVASPPLHPEPKYRIHLSTISAIAVVSLLISTLTHEALGHGLTAILVGAHLQHVSSVDASYSSEGVAAWSLRIVHAAGIITNIILGLIVLTIMKKIRSISSNQRYFLWLLGHVNLYIGGGYMMALSFAGFGDVEQFVDGLESPFLWKLAFTIIGIIISFAALKHGVRTLDPFLRQDRSVRRRRARTLSLVPYLVAGVVSVASGMLNPVGMILVAISAAASSFGG